MVRLGEHDTETEIDGEHVDLDIARVESHKHYLSALKINDIAVVHLDRDVDFTGINWNANNHFFSEQV